MGLWLSGASDWHRVFGARLWIVRSEYFSVRELSCADGRLEVLYINVHSCIYIALHIFVTVSDIDGSQ